VVHLGKLGGRKLGLSVENASCFGLTLVHGSRNIFGGALGEEWTYSLNHLNVVYSGAFDHLRLTSVLRLRPLSHTPLRTFSTSKICIRIIGH
jgi:hypothetical protein